MSLKAMVWVLENSEAKLGDRLVLLALAEHAGDDGEDSYPAQATLAAKARLSERQVRRCLNNLESEGRIVEDGKSRYGTVCWRIVMTPDNMSARTSTTPKRHDMSAEPSFEPSLSVEAEGTHALTAEEPSLRTRAREAAPMKVDRKPVSAAEYFLAENVLGHWNIIAKQDLTSDEWVRKIVMRIREHPELTSDDHYRIIHAAFTDPWWKGISGPSVVYGNGAVFEQALMLYRNGPPPPRPANGTMRYGRGMTTAQILEATRGLE